MNGRSAYEGITPIIILGRQPRSVTSRTAYHELPVDDLLISNCTRVENLDAGTVGGTSKGQSTVVEWPTEVTVETAAIAGSPANGQSRYRARVCMTFLTSKTRHKTTAEAFHTHQSRLIRLSDEAQKQKSRASRNKRTREELSFVAAWASICLTVSKETSAPAERME